jgi:hypothetical protein
MSEIKRLGGEILEHLRCYRNLGVHLVEKKTQTGRSGTPSSRVGQRALAAVGSAHRRARLQQAFGAVMVAASLVVVAGYDLPLRGQEIEQGET